MHCTYPQCVQSYNTSSLGRLEFWDEALVKGFVVSQYLYVQNVSMDHRAMRGSLSIFQRFSGVAMIVPVILECLRFVNVSMYP